MKMNQERVQKGTPEFKSKLQIMREKNQEKVRGIFRYYELPGGVLSFVMGGQYGSTGVDKYVLTDGHLCTLPLGVAKHLNKNGWYPVHEYRQEDNGLPSQQIGKKVRRFGFQSLDFIDESDFSDQANIIIAPDSFGN